LVTYIFCGNGRTICNTSSLFIERRIGGLAIIIPSGRSKETPMSKNPTGFPDFEISNEVRNFAEQSVEQARKAFDGFIAAAEKAASTFGGQAAAVQMGAKDVRQKAISFAEQNVATSFDFAQRLVRARDPEEVLRLQAEFIQAQMTALSEQAQQLGQAASKAATETTKQTS
jgi:phasin